MRTLNLSLLFILFALGVNGQLFNQKDPLVKINVRKTGAYLGLQAGSYYVPEFGTEIQWKRIKLDDPKTHALHTGFNYNFKYNVLGYDLGYWHRPNRVGLTYGGNLVYRTDFTHGNFGVVPVVGYKIFQLHLQTGYHFLMPSEVQYETNRFFVSLRWVIINDRDYDFKWRKRKK